MLILATWLASLRFGYLFFSQMHGVASVGAGIINVEITQSKVPSSPIAEVVISDFDTHDYRGLGMTMPRWVSRIVRVTHGPDWVLSGIELPLWLLLLLTAIPTAWLWHRDRRRIRPGCCLRCGYDLTGNTSGVCSECGEKKAMANSEERIAKSE